MLLVAMGFGSVQAQNNFFTRVTETQIQHLNSDRKIIPNAYLTYSLDTLQLKNLLQSAPMEFTEEARSNPVILSLPMPDGTVQQFSIVESPVQQPALMAKFPNIRTYSGQGLNDKTATIRIDWNDFGFHSQILSANGNYYIDPYARGNKLHYIIYDKNSLNPKQFTESGVLEGPADAGTPNMGAKTAGGPCVGTQLRTYRLAVACTGEYAAAVGGTNASLLHSAIVTSVNRVNGVYEKEVSIRLTLVADNNKVEFLSAASDPFQGNNNDQLLINESQRVIDSAIGSANYDIGHTFSTGGGGLAQRPSVCINGAKARGITGSPNPTGDAYDIDYVAHEMGHQFGGNHTFNATSGSCNGNRSASTSVEPGSGVTIMAYAGICGSQNLASNSIPYFHAISFDEIANYSNNSTGNNCAVKTNTGNNPPVVNAGADYTIPASTPFMLTGSATDADGDALTYSWEEIDPGTAAGNWNSGSKPFFRSFSPVASPTRYFPKMSDILSNTQTIGEFLPTTNQTLNFRLTARDNKNGGGGVCYDEMVVNVVNTGTPFKVTSQSGATTWTANGTNTATITWDVANTTASPVNAANVDILLSVDGGLTFPYTIKSATPNDGTETIVIPSVNTTAGRLMVKGSNNIFFSVATGSITVTSACGAEGAVITPQATVSAPAGSASLNLGLTPQYSTPLTPSGTLTSSLPATSLSVTDQIGFGCQSFVNNQFRYTTFTFVPNQTASYTFTKVSTANTVMMTLYSGSYDPASPCTNFLASNGQYTGTAIAVSNSINAFLTANQTYVLAVGTFSASQPTLPAAFNISVSASPSGNIYSGSQLYFNPGAGFSYAYVIVNNSTGIIRAISNTADLSNAANFPAGSYTVYGFSYSNTVSNLSSYVGQSFTSFANNVFSNPSTLCGNLSKNTVTVNINAVVPVTFVELKAKKNNRVADLTWGTLTEQNSDVFIVEHSANGAEFAAVGTVKAAGNSNALINYSFKHNNPVNGMNYYRIKQVDRDGKYMYSNVATVEFNISGASVLTIYPNPVKNNLGIEIRSVRQGRVIAQVMDVKGAVLKQTSFNVVTGTNVNSLDVTNLSNGVYILKLTDASGNITHTRFIKQ